MDDKPPLKWAWSGSHDPLLITTLHSCFQNGWSESHQILYANFRWPTTPNVRSQGTWHDL